MSSSVVDVRWTSYYYDVNALSNFVVDAPRVIGFNPFVNLADFLEAEVAHAQG
jgi:hypothetical protein